MKAGWLAACHALGAVGAGWLAMAPARLEGDRLRLVFTSRRQVNAQNSLQFCIIQNWNDFIEPGEVLLYSN
jgi:hypothetical protein